MFPTDDGTGKIENRIKLIRNESIGNYFWNTTEVASTSSYNNWTRATLKVKLNGTYLYGLTSEAQNMIGNAKYYLGGYYNIPNTQKDTMYQYERKIKNTKGNEFYFGTNPNSWTGKLALMYASDYGYAASEECTENLYYYNNATCKNNNWLLNSVSQWTLSQVAGGDGTALYVTSSGPVYDNRVNSLKNGVRPVLYLTSSVQITGGSGTSSDPYTLGL